MGRHKQGIDRNQISMELLDFETLVASDNPVRAIDSIVNRLICDELGLLGKNRCH